MMARRKGEYISRVCKSFTSRLFFLLFIDKKKNALLILVSLEIISIPFTRLFSLLLLRQKFSNRPTHPIRLRTTQHTNPIIFQLFQVDSIYFQEQEKNLGPPNPKKKKMKTTSTKTTESVGKKSFRCTSIVSFTLAFEKWEE